MNYIAFFNLPNEVTVNEFGQGEWVNPMGRLVNSFIRHIRCLLNVSWFGHHCQMLEQNEKKAIEFKLFWRISNLLN